VTHLVAHLLREVESAVRYVLDPTFQHGRGHRVSVVTVLDELGISHDDPVAELDGSIKLPQPVAGRVAQILPGVFAWLQRTDNPRAGRSVFLV
jgi:hypothetical protein